MSLHIKEAWRTLLHGPHTIHTLSVINATHQRRIRELEQQEGAAREAVKSMVKPECLKELNPKPEMEG